MMKKWYAVLTALLMALLFGCGHSKQEAKEKKTIVTTSYPVYYMTKEIVKDQAEVVMLIDGSVDAHDYEPSAKDIARIHDSMAFVYISDTMEPWAKQIEKSLSQSKTVFISSGEKIHEIEEAHEEHGEEDTDHEHEHGETDPHIWLDPANAILQTETIAEKLMQIDEANKELYLSNKNDLVSKLKEIDQEYVETFSKKGQTVFAVQHAAFGYIAHRFGLIQLAVELLGSTEPSAQDIIRIQQEIKEHQLTTLYVDPLHSLKTAEIISKETGVAIKYLYTMESPVENKDFLELLRENLKSLKEGLAL